jgi:hypothetical protein
MGIRCKIQFGSPHHSTPHGDFLFYNASPGYVLFCLFGLLDSIVLLSSKGPKPYCALSVIKIQYAVLAVKRNAV